MKVNELSKRVATLELKLAALETAFNGHDHSYMAHPMGEEPATTGGASDAEAVTDEQINTRTTAIVGDSSNSKVKHGEL